MISGLGDLQQWLGMSVALSRSVLVACLGPSSFGSPLFDLLTGVFRPLSCCLLVFVCGKWLLLACVAFFISCCCFPCAFGDPDGGTVPPLCIASILLWSLSVLVGLSSYAVCLCLVCFVCCPPQLFVLAIACFFSPPVLAVRCFLVCSFSRGVRGGSAFFCFFAFCLNV